MKLKKITHGKTLLVLTGLVLLAGCSESEEETEEEEGEGGGGGVQSKKILRETDLEDSFLVPDGVEIVSESDDSLSADEQVETRFDQSEEEDSPTMSRKGHFKDDSESDESPVRPLKSRTSDSVIQLDSDSDRTPEKTVKTRTQKISVSDSEKTPAKPVKSKTLKKVLLVDSDSDKSPEKAVKTRINKKATLIDSDCDETPEKSKVVKTRTKKKVEPDCGKTSNKRVKPKFVGTNLKPESRQIEKEIRTFVPKTFLQSLNEDISCPM